MIRAVRVLQRALRDLEEIRSYVERDRPEAAGQLVGRLLDRMESLGRHPNAGVRPRDDRLRKLDYLFLVEDSYLVFYKVDRRVVRIYRVLHGKRRYETVL